ncbi:MAG TPA: hypothetical protein VHW66_23025 [Stellaceae bacterium]|nr:hypothetical protein [Stellaceae bacterium]
MISDEALESLCAIGSKGFFPLLPEAAPTIADYLINAIRDAIPTSLIRVGDGEGNALGVIAAPRHPANLESFNHKFISQNGLEIGEDEAFAFCQMIRDALVSADIIGFRSCDRTILRSELAQISGNVEHGRFMPALGMTYARELLRAELVDGAYRDKIVTSAWIHLWLIPHLSRIMDAAESIIVITGQAELEDQFKSRLGRRLRSFLRIPVEGYRPKSRDDSHFHTVFPRIVDLLHTDLRGTLVLVGAGFFGKIYSQTARDSGAVAIDLGSGFDLLAGKETRPVHSNFAIQMLRWL